MSVRAAVCSLPREAGEGWGGGQRAAALARRCAPRAPLPTSPRKRGEESLLEAS